MQSHKKCIAVIACALLCCALLPLTAFAHSGRTDSRGGHYDYQMGLYHYHHGFPAHGHPDGVCPFDPNYEENLDKTAGMEHNDEWYWDEDKTQPEKTEKAALQKSVTMYEAENHIFKPWEIVLCIIFNAIWIIPFLLLVVISPFAEKRERSKKEQEYLKQYGPRMLCMDCKFCKTRLHRPFYNSNMMATYHPSYCSKFRIELKWDINLRCQARRPEDAERYATTKNYLPRKRFPWEDQRELNKHVKMPEDYLKIPEYLKQDRFKGQWHSFVLLLPVIAIAAAAIIVFTLIYFS